MTAVMRCARPGCGRTSSWQPLCWKVRTERVENVRTQLLHALRYTIGTHPELAANAYLLGASGDHLTTAHRCRQMHHVAAVMRSDPAPDERRSPDHPGCTSGPCPHLLRASEARVQRPFGPASQGPTCRRRAPAASRAPIGPPACIGARPCHSHHPSRHPRLHIRRLPRPPRGHRGRVRCWPSSPSPAC